MSPNPPRARFTRLDVVMGRLTDLATLYDSQSPRHDHTPLWLAADTLRELRDAGRLDAHPTRPTWGRYRGRDVQPLAAI